MQQFTRNPHPSSLTAQSSLLGPRLSSITLTLQPMFVKNLAHAEHEAVPRAVHGLHAKLLALDVEDEHVVLVVCRVPRDLPQLEVEDVGRDHFLVPALEVLNANKVDELVVDPRPVRKPEARAWPSVRSRVEGLRG